MKEKIFGYVMSLLFTLILASLSVERPGEGEQKKKEAVDIVVKMLTEFGVPAGIAGSLANLGIDLIVKQLNSLGIFK
jgi:5-enolpyruvylshikimate-3-phosphate synthase